MAMLIVGINVAVRSGYGVLSRVVQRRTQMWTRN
jgi:hypothetical protein